MSTASESDPEPADSPAGSADQIYSAPAAAQAEAKRIVSDPASTDSERAEALATLGRSAYYGNRMHEAIAYLESALPLTADATRHVDIALILAPALSKEGRSSEALALLDFPAGGLSSEQAGKAHNQRGIILIELGRLPEAVAAFGKAREMYRANGHLAGEGRALINMAAATSEIGDQDHALALYEEAWQLTTETDQVVMNAMIEGNLGYVASRRGDFGVALSWYQRARDSFSKLGEVDLLAAVLEVDHATTLLDLGLNNDAFEAAEFARRSSASGSNKMLEVQAGLLLGEAQVRLRHYRAAEQTLAVVRESAIELKVKPWELRCEYLLHRLRAADGDTTAGAEQGDVMALVAGLCDAAWYREALRAIVLAATRAVDLGDRDGALQLLGRGASINNGDPIDRHHADALEAFLVGDAGAMEGALSKGFAEIDRQRQLLGSAEFQMRLGHRARDLRTIALRSPLGARDPALAVAAHARGRPRGERSVSGADKLRSQLRDARVGVQEARLASKPLHQLEARIEELESELLAAAPVEATIAFDPADLLSDSDVATVVYIGHQDNLWAVCAANCFELHDLGPIGPIESAVRAQRTALRRMAGATTNDRAMDRSSTANARLDELLISPLRSVVQGPLLIVPDGPVRAVSWAGLPSLSLRALTVAPNVQAAAGVGEACEVGSVGLMGGPALRHASEEVDALSAVWRGLAPSVSREADVADAVAMFTGSDLVHVAAHGTFRPDNPLFSTLEFFDRPLRIVEFEGLDQLPRIVVLAACDTGTAGAGGNGLIGTAEALLALGVHAVVAPSLVVDDGAALRFSVDFHAALVGGASIAGAACAARKLAVERGAAVDVAAAHAFQVHGGRSASIPLTIATIEKVWNKSAD